MGETVRFRLVPDRSRVRIHATSNVHPVDGEAGGLEGRVVLTIDDSEPDLGDPVEASVELAVAALSSGNPAYDAEMRRRLEERRYPTISGRLTTVERLGAGGRFRVSGDLTFHGATRTVSTEMTVTFDDSKRLLAQWEQRIDIRDFNMKPPRILMFKVDPDVRVEVDIVAERE